jgi:hypothetical protein
VTQTAHLPSTVPMVFGSSPMLLGPVGRVPGSDANRTPSFNSSYGLRLLPASAGDGLSSTINDEPPKPSMPATHQLRESKRITQLLTTKEGPTWSLPPPPPKKKKAQS